jgi:nucleoside diphosphate kinase
VKQGASIMKSMSTKKINLLFLKNAKYAAFYNMLESRVFFADLVSPIESRHIVRRVMGFAVWAEV